MIKVKFNDSSNFLDVNFSQEGVNIVQLLGNVPANTSGFTTWKSNGKRKLGDFSDYITIYRQLENGVQFSNDGSVYVKPNEDNSNEYDVDSVSEKE